MKTAIFLANGFEEIEALTVVDILRRCKIEIDMISITDRSEVCGSHHITVQADKLLHETSFADYDMLILPGGKAGVENLEACKPLIQLLIEFDKAQKRISAICAAPSILGHLGILRGRNACAYPTFEKELSGAEVTGNEVEISEHIITSRGMGCSIPFALTIVEKLLNREVAEECKKTIIYEQRNKS